MLYSNELYIGITTSTSSTLSRSVLLILETEETNGALFLKGNFLTYTLLSEFVTVIVPLTTIHASLKSHKSYLRIDALTLVSLLTL